MILFFIINLTLECKIVNKEINLIRAINKNDYNKAIKIIESNKDIDLNQLNKFGKAALHAACKKNNIELIERLIKKGADINIKDKDGNTPLHIATLLKSNEIIKLLLEYNVDPNIKNNKNENVLSSLLNSEIKKAYGNITFHSILTQIWYKEEVKQFFETKTFNSNGLKRAKGFFSLIIIPLSYLKNIRFFNKYKESIKELNSINKDVLILLTNKTNLNDTNLMYKAIFLNLKEMVEVLIKNNKSILDKEDKYGITPLYFACLMENLKMVRLLISLGADVNKFNKYDINALHLATFLKNVKMLKLLIEKDADINSVNKYGINCLHLAVFFNNTSYLTIIQALLNNGADINIKDKDGFAPLHIIVANEWLELLEMFLKYKVNINEQDNEGNTALHIISSKEENYKNKLMFSYLLKAKADVNIKNKEGRTALHLAALSENINAIETLLENGCDPDIQDIDGNIALHLALFKYNSYAISRLEERSNEMIKNNAGVSCNSIINSPIKKLYSQNPKILFIILLFLFSLMP